MQRKLHGNFAGWTEPANRKLIANVNWLVFLKNERFLAILDRVMPTWRMSREELNRSPLAHQEWSY